MLQIFSTVYENTLKKINSHADITKTYHEGEPLPIGTFLLKHNFSQVHFSVKLKRFEYDHTKFYIDCLTSPLNSFHKMAPHYTFTGTT